MKCWKCGEEINDGTTECVYCHADQRRSTPMTDIGRGMRQLYDRYGAEAVLTNPVLLSNGLGDVVADTLETNIKKLKSQLKMAMDAGLGRLYREQLTVGKPDERFTERARILLTEDVGFNEKTADEMIGYFDEMIGWQDLHTIPVQPAPKPTENPIREKVPKEESDYAASLKSDIYNKALSYFQLDTLFGYEEALRLFSKIPGYASADNYADMCCKKIDELTKTDDEDQKAPNNWRWAFILLCLLAAGIIYYFIHNQHQKERNAYLATDQSIQATQTKLAAPAEKSPAPIKTEFVTPTPVYGTVYVKGNTGALIRAIPSLYSEGIKGVYNYAVLEITGETISADGYTWTSIRTNEGFDGWIVADVLRTETPVPDADFVIKDGVLEGYKGITDVMLSSNYPVSQGPFATSGLTTIEIPKSANTIGRFVFSGCSSLKSITIPDSVTTIGAYACQGCSGFKKTKLPFGLTIIDEKVFYRCTGLKSITIPSNVKSIGNYSFNKCSNLSEITIPDSVTSIGYGAFTECNKLKSVTIPENVTKIERIAFDKDCILKVKQNSYADSWCQENGHKCAYY